MVSLIILRVFRALRRIAKKIRHSTPLEIRIRRKSAEVVKRYGIHDWFCVSPQSHDYHLHAVRYIRKHVPKDSTILETGCGIGQTFVVLHKYGYHSFIGIEANHQTVRAAEEFLTVLRVEAKVIHDDGLNATTWIDPSSIDVYLPLNWTHSTPHLAKVFDIGFSVLRDSGLMIIDIINKDFVSSSLQDMETYHNSYKYRYSKAEVLSLARARGFSVEYVSRPFLWRWLMCFRKSLSPLSETRRTTGRST